MICQVICVGVRYVTQGSWGSGIEVEVCPCNPEVTIPSNHGEPQQGVWAGLPILLILIAGFRFLTTRRPSSVCLT